MNKKPSGEIPHGDQGGENNIIQPELPPDKDIPQEVKKSKQEVQKITHEEKEDDTKEQIEETRKRLQEMPEITVVVERTPASEREREERIRNYQKKYLPRYLKGKKGLIGRLIAEKHGNSIRFETEGRENIPEHGPFLIVCNHHGGGEVESIFKTFQDYNVHFGLAKNIWWNTPLKWVFKQLQMIPLEESLSNISEEKKEEALLNQGAQGKEVFRRIIDREKRGEAPMNMNFFHQAIAVLSQGDALAMFPEGLWLKPFGVGKISQEKVKGLKQGYQGVELIVRQYKKLTGDDLPVLPLAFIADRVHDKRYLKIGKPLVLEQNPTQLTGTDWSMAHVACMLPEDDRGYYTQMVHEIHPKRVR